MRGGSRSEGALGLGAALRRAGWTYADMKAALLACPATQDWAAEVDERQFERIWDRGDDVPPKAPPEPTPETIDGDWWIARELTRPVPVLGEVICASTRALIGGPTGAGKTHLAMAMAGAIITSREFLHWAGPAKPLVVLYIDGEI
jgi:RecA-family ATPase